MSEIIDLPKDVREELEKLDEEVYFLEHVHEDLKTWRRMIKIRKYD